MRWLLTALAGLLIHGIASATPPIDTSIVGQYQIQAGYAMIEVQDIGAPFYRISCPHENWTSVGVLDGRTYVGVFRKRSESGFVVGRHLIDWTPGDHPIESQFPRDGNIGDSRKWNRIPPAKPHEPTNTDRPALGEYVYVEELPEAITKAQPVYPDEARRARVDGTVVIQTLVLSDGTVGDTRIVKSDSSLLDDAAVAAVRQWKFKPAVARGKPVAVWVAVPVRFRLH